MALGLWPGTVAAGQVGGWQRQWLAGYLAGAAEDEGAQSALPA